MCSNPDYDRMLDCGNRPPAMYLLQFPHTYSVILLEFYLVTCAQLGLFWFLFGVLHRFQHGTGYITTGSWKGRGNQYIQLVKVLYCKLPINDKQLPAFPLEAVLGTEPRPQRWETRVLPLCHCAPLVCFGSLCQFDLNLQYVKSNLYVTVKKI